MLHPPQLRTLLCASPSSAGSTLVRSQDVRHRLLSLGSLTCVMARRVCCAFVIAPFLVHVCLGRCSIRHGGASLTAICLVCNTNTPRASQSRASSGEGSEAYMYLGTESQENFRGLRKFHALGSRNSNTVVDTRLHLLQYTMRNWWGRAVHIIASGAPARLSVVSRQLSYIR